MRLTIQAELSVENFDAIDVFGKHATSSFVDGGHRVQAGAEYDIHGFIVPGPIWCAVVL